MRQNYVWEREEDIPFLLESMMLVSAACIMVSDWVFTLGETSRHIYYL